MCGFSFILCFTVLRLTRGIHFMNPPLIHILRFWGGNIITNSLFAATMLRSFGIGGVIHIPRLRGGNFAAVMLRSSGIRGVIIRLCISRAIFSSCPSILYINQIWLGIWGCIFNPLFWLGQGDLCVGLIACVYIFGALHCAWWFAIGLYIEMVIWCWRMNW